MRTATRVVLTLGAAIALFVGFLSWMSAAEEPVPPPGVLEPIRADRLLSASPEPPDQDDPAWTPVTLPDHVAVSRERLAVAWYRLRVDIDPARHRLWSLFLRRPWTTAAVWVNGTLVDDAGSDRRPLPFYVSDLNFVIPAGLVRNGGNEILVRSVRERSYAYLGTVWLGDAEQLTAFKTRTSLYTQTYVRVIVVVIVVLSLVYAGLFAMRRRETAYGWFAAALLMWAIQNAWTQFDTPPISPAWSWRPVAFIALGWFVICAAVFVHRFARLSRPRTERSLFLIGILGPIALWTTAATDEVAYRIMGPFIWVPLVCLLGLYVGWCLLKALRTGPVVESQALAIVALFLAMVGIRDYLRDRGLVESAIGLYLPYAAPVVLLVFGSILLRRFVLALDESERLNRELEARVAEKSTAIEASYAQIAQMETQRARTEERERLMRDMHDGIGGQLVQALAMVDRHVDNARMREVIQSCLDDLRLVIDTSATGSESLGAVLASLRNRMRRRLEGSGVELDWPPAADSEHVVLSPHATLQVLRIFQEAISNALRHAQATGLHVTCKVEAGSPLRKLILIVADNGCGFDPAAAHAGRGLGNLRKRAEELGGSLDIASGESGTCIRATIPIAGEAAAQRI
jgi:signal transduction histidine kinase